MKKLALVLMLIVLMLVVSGCSVEIIGYASYDKETRELQIPVELESTESYIDHLIVYYTLDPDKRSALEGDNPSLMGFIKSLLNVL